MHMREKEKAIFIVAIHNIKFKLAYIAVVVCFLTPSRFANPVAAAASHFVAVSVFCRLSIPA